MILEPPMYPNHVPKLSDPILGIDNPTPELRGRVAGLMSWARDCTQYGNPPEPGRPIRLEIAAEAPEPHESSTDIMATVYLANPRCKLELLDEGVLIHAITVECECKPLATKRLG